MTPEHLITAPILIPLVAGAIMLFYEDRQRRVKFVISLTACVAMFVIALELLIRSKGPSGGSQIGLYLLGDWPTPFGINLVLDRLSALMLVLSSALAIPALAYSYAGWHSRGQHFHSLFMFQLMGVNGAFLTGDLFNLFVFFEIMLAASYGLLLHGSGPERVRAGMQYIVMNLVASLFFLIGVSLIYGVAGTLNMADLAQKMPYLSGEDRPMIHAAMALLGIVFLVKAASWPLGMWLPSTYQSASPPAAAIFAILTKVGVYIILRLGFLAFAPGSGISAGFGAEVVLMGGLASMTFGTLGMLGSQSVGRMAGFSVLISSGTMLAVTGLALMGGGVQMLAGALYYMTVSTLGIAALFLLVELVDRGQGTIAAMLALSADLYGAPEDEPEETQRGITVPATMTVLSLCFAALAVLLAGLPPLGGFLGKVMMLSGMLQGGQGGSVASWIFMALLIVSGLATLIALLRIGVQTFWTSSEESGPNVLAIELAPIVALTGLVVLLTWEARPVMRYMEATASALHRPGVYIDGVLSAARTFDMKETVE